MLCPKRHLELIATLLVDQWDICWGIGMCGRVTEAEDFHVGKSGASQIDLLTA